MKTRKNYSLPQLRAEMIRLTLPDTCKKAGVPLEKVLRVARIWVHEEDIEGKPKEKRQPLQSCRHRYEKQLRLNQLL